MRGSISVNARFASLPARRAARVRHAEPHAADRQRQHDQQQGAAEDVAGRPAFDRAGPARPRPLRRLSRRRVAPSAADALVPQMRQRDMQSVDVLTVSDSNAGSIVSDDSTDIATTTRWRDRDL